MKPVRLAAAAGALAAAALSPAPASAFTCNGPTIDTDPVGVPGIATVQVCSEGARVLPGPALTSAGQVGVTVLGEEICLGYHRIVVDASGVSYRVPPFETTCP